MRERRIVQITATPGARVIEPVMTEDGVDREGDRFKAIGDGVGYRTFMPA